MAGVPKTGLLPKSIDFPLWLQEDAGSSRSTLEMKCSHDNRWLPMTQVETIDPGCLAMHRLNPLLAIQANNQTVEDVLGWKMDYPNTTKHIWQAPLPADLPLGTHTITIRTTDMFGKVYTAHRIFRVRSLHSP